MTRVFRLMEFPITPAALARNADEAVAAAKPYLAAGHRRRHQDPIARHRAQVGSRRRPPQPHQRAPRCVRPLRTFSARRGRRGPRRASPASRFFR